MGNNEKTNRRGNNSTWVLTIVYIIINFGGESGIRTHGILRYAGLVNQCFRPLSHLSFQSSSLVYKARVVALSALTKITLSFGPI